MAKDRDKRALAKVANRAVAGLVAAVLAGGATTALVMSARHECVGPVCAGASAGSTGCV